MNVDVSSPGKRHRASKNDTWLWPKGPPPGDDWGNPQAFEPRCKDVPGTIGENYAFLNADQPLATRVPVAYLNGVQDGVAGPISQFDAVLMLQCPASAGNKCD